MYHLNCVAVTLRTQYSVSSVVLAAEARTQPIRGVAVNALGNVTVTSVLAVLAELVPHWMIMPKKGENIYDYLLW